MANTKDKKPIKTTDKKAGQPKNPKKNTSAKRSKAGQPPHKTTPETRSQVCNDMANGITQVVIAHRLGIHPDTLREHYQFELEHGKMIAKGEAGGRMWEMAKKAVHDKDYIKAAMWQDQSRFGYKQGLDITSDGEKMGAGAIVAVSNHRIMNDEDDSTDKA